MVVLARNWPSMNRLSAAWSTASPGAFGSTQRPAASRWTMTAVSGIDESRSSDAISLASRRLANTTQPIKVGDMIGAEMAW